jgi:TusA-related sulfurtransferase
MDLLEYGLTKKYLIEEVYNLYRKGYSDEEIHIMTDKKYSQEDISNWIECTNYLYV